MESSNLKNSTILRNIILDHYENPKHKKDDVSNLQSLVNYHNKSSTCIDDIQVFLDIKDNVIKKCYFYGLGCAISISSTDIFCQIFENKTIQDAKVILNEYKKMIDAKNYNEELLDELIAFYNVPNQPNRIKCSLIGHDAFKYALDGYENEK